MWSVKIETSRVKSHVKNGLFSCDYRPFQDVGNVAIC